MDHELTCAVLAEHDPLPKVERVARADGLGSTIDPPLNERDSDLRKLRWHAAVVKLDTGLTFYVTPSRYSISGVAQSGYFTLHGVDTSVSPLTFRSAWSYLNGIDLGVSQLRAQGVRA